MTYNLRVNFTSATFGMLWFRKQFTSTKDMDKWVKENVAVMAVVPHPDGDGKTFPIKSIKLHISDIEEECTIDSLDVSYTIK